jgi:steroid 5-alpha reductase family enzyme
MSLSLLLAILATALFAYMSVWFFLARTVKRIDVIDSAWGLGFIYVALIGLFSQAPMPAAARGAAILTGIWGLRLTVHITKRNMKRSEDPRYAAYRKKWGDQFWVMTFLKIYMVQGLLILLVSTPVIAIENSPHQSWSALVWLGFAVWIFGILFESVADTQLKRFLAAHKEKGIMQSGLWRYSRHPNYFGEITTWVGAALVAGGLGRWWGLIGPAVIAYVITQISGLPPLEKRYAHDKDYQAYARRTSVLIPRPPHHD